MKKALAPAHQMSLFTLIMVSSAFVVSVRNLPTLAETGFEMFFFIITAAIFFFIPAALVSAELATGWPEQGGVYVWVREAFGEFWGFFAIWLQWFYMVLTVISVLYFLGGSLAYIFAPQLANNKIYLILITWIFTWGLTFLSFKGQKLSSSISTYTFIFGVLIPALLIIGLGIFYLFGSQPVHLHWNFSVNKLFPDFRHIATLVLIVGFMKAFAGIEASASHANEVKNPVRNYPIAILVVVLFGIGINLLGSASIATVVPKKDISLVSGLMEAFAVFLPIFHMKWFVPIMGLLVSSGAIASVSTWIMGPVKGLLSTAEDGRLPAFCKKTNKNGVPTTLLTIQAWAISIIGTLLLLMPNINVAFWITVAVSMMCYFTMYIFMLIAGIYLRYKEPTVKRAYKIPGKHNLGMWIVGIVGLLTMLFSLIIAFVPPAELPPANEQLYISLLIGIAIITCIVPFVIYRRTAKA